MHRQVTVNFVERDWGYHVYVYRRETLGRKRRIGGLRSYFIPRKGPDVTPQSLLRALAAEMDLPLVERWMPPAQPGPASPSGDHRGV